MSTGTTEIQGFSINQPTQASISQPLDETTIFGLSVSQRPGAAQQPLDETTILGISVSQTPQAAGQPPDETLFGGMSLVGHETEFVGVPTGRYVIIRRRYM